MATIISPEGCQPVGYNEGPALQHDTVHPLPGKIIAILDHCKYQLLVPVYWK